MHRILKFDITNVTGVPVNTLVIPIDIYALFTPLHVEWVEGLLYLWARTSPITNADIQRRATRCIIKSVWPGVDFALDSFTYLATVRSPDGLVHHIHTQILTF